MIVSAAATAWAGPYTLFESGPVRPLAKSPDGTRLFATNIPDNRLEIFSIGAGGGLTHLESVVVGLEPVAVAARTNSEVWVVNHLSDSISIVDVSTSPARVVRTLLVGDEPRDIVFAGPGGSRAFVTCARRGQNNPNDPQLTTPGVGRADVWVFDAANLGTSLGGTPLTIITMFGDTPRALAVSPNGNTVYAAVFHSGNKTTVVSEGAVCNDGNKNDTTVAGPCTVGGQSVPGGLPLPTQDHNLAAAPEVGLIVRHNGTFWSDLACAGGSKFGWSCSTNADCPGSTCGRNWNNAVKFSLPDRDVFLIDATANPPVQISGSNGYRTGVGTILFNMVTNPISGNVYVSNLEAHNEVRFEGPGTYAAQFGGSTVQGRIGDSRITVISGSSVTPRHLNKHIDYSQRPAPAGVKDHSLATPVDMVVSSNGATLYVSAFGSSKVGVFNTAALENNTFTPNNADYITVSGGGPGGLVLNETFHRLYVYTRFDNGIAVVDTQSRSEVDHLSLYNPEPASVVNGRPFLYDAFYTSSNGEAACASCHIFSDLDSLAWDLGNPDDHTEDNPLTVKLSIAAGSGTFTDFHPMKGPMATQTLRGMNTHGAMHWRGDRNGGPGQVFNEDLAFKAFNPAFVGLVGRTAQLTTAEMQAYTDFILQVALPPNPIRALDNSLTPAQTTANTFYFGNPRRADGIPFGSDGADNALGFSCNGCHTSNRNNGFFGADGKASFENEPQVMKVAHLRNLYQKVGMFGMPAVSFFNSGNNGNQGDQIRGFGFLHDGSTDTLFRFFNATVFNSSNGVGFGFSGNADQDRRDMEQLMLAFDTNLFPIVGQQVTLTNSNSGVAGPRIDLLLAQAALGRTDVVVKGMYNGALRGWYRTSGGTFQSDKSTDAPLSDAALRTIANTAGQELTYTAVPLGSAVRIGVDRDEDGHFDRNEIEACSDPADPGSTPGAGCPTTPTPTGTPTATPSVTNTPTHSPTNTPLPTNTPTSTPTNTPTETHTASPTITPGGPTLTPTNSPTETPIPTLTATWTPTQTPTNTPLPTNTPIPTDTPTETPTQTPTSTETPTPTETPSPSPTETVPPPPDVYCLSGSLIQAPRVRVLANHSPAGDEKFTMSGNWVLHNSSPQIDPLNNGFRFAVYDDAGNLLYDRVIPGGPLVTTTGPGWKLSPNGLLAKYRDDAGTIGGIRRISVRSSAKVPGHFFFKVTGKLADFQVPAGAEPVNIAVVLGGHPQADAFQCAIFSFNPETGLRPKCKPSKTGKALACL